MMHWIRPSQWLSLSLVILALAILSPPRAHAKTYTLTELITLVRQNNPGVAATRSATNAVEAQLLEAQRSRWPTGELLSMVAPVPEVRCSVPSVQGAPLPGWETPPGISDKAWREQNCVQTATREAVRVAFAGVLTRTQINLIQPLYTFGKITAGIEAAEAGIEAAENRTKATLVALDFNVKRAYYGLKLARAILSTLEEGLGYVEEAEQYVQKALDEGTGEMSTTDKLRIQTVRAEVQSRVIEARKGIQIAKEGLRALIGPKAPQDIDVDPEDLTQLSVRQRKQSHYVEQAQFSRPEIRALDFFVRSRRKLAELEWRRQFPDLVLIGSVTFAYANSIDDPQNAFLNDPFNRFAPGMVAALNMPLDLGVRNARARRMLAEAEQASFQRREALAGIEFEIARAFAELDETRQRVEILADGERLARRWMTSNIQKLELGLAETRDLTDALQGYFNMRLRHLQAIHDFNLAVADMTRATGAEISE